MNIWNIMRKEITVSLRDKRTFTFMLAFPIVLMLILGTALSNAFSSTAKISMDMKLLVQNEAKNASLTAYWDGFAKAIGEQGVRVVPAGAGTDGQEEVRSDNYSAYAVIGDSGIQLYLSSKETMESNIIQGMLTAFADRYNLAAAALKENPAGAQTIIANAGSAGDFIRETALNADKTPGSLDYYAMSMTTMIALYSAISGSMLFRGEKVRNTAIRLMASPVSKGEIFAGKVLGCTFINLLCVFAVVLFSKFVFKAEWGSHLGIVLLVLFTEVLLAVSLGLGLSYLFKGDSPRSVVMIITQIASFIGGAYFPVGGTEGIMTFVTNLSPLRWANTAMIEIIYADNLWAALPAIGLNAGIAAAFLALAIISMRRREAL